MRKSQKHIFKFLVLIFLLTAMPAAAFAEGFSGTYQVTAVADQNGKTYTTSVGIEDLGNGEIELSASFQGIPFTLVGKSDSATSDGGVYKFEVNIPSLVTGQAEVTINKADGGYEVTGKGSGDYNFMGKSGSGSGTGSGKRSGGLSAVNTGLPALENIAKPVDFLAADSSFPTPNLFTILGAAGLSLLGAFVSRFAAGMGSSVSSLPDTGDNTPAESEPFEAEPPEEAVQENYEGTDEGGDE